MELGCLVVLDSSLGGSRYEAELAWSSKRVGRVS